MTSKEKIRKNNFFQEPVTELRRDLITKEWVAIAPKRGKRPSAYKFKGGRKLDVSKKNCPFENPQATGHAQPALLYKNRKHKDWSLQIIPNKFPILYHADKCSIEGEHGPYKITDGTGSHEIIITKDHNKHLALLSRAEVTEVVTAYKERFSQLIKDDCTQYVSIFHNHGVEAGATLFHPHSQLIATSIVPADIQRSISGSYNYYRFNKRCAHCDIILWEKKEKLRILFENKEYIAFCPYVSRVNFEIEIFPKKHSPNFENTPVQSLSRLADLLNKSLNLLYKTLDNPAYNFFIHTAPMPTDKKKYPHYHWHIEIFPKTNTWAGIELGTGMEVLMVSPENAASHLRENI